MIVFPDKTFITMSSDDRRSLERRAQGLGDKPALLIVDVINGFTDPTCPLGSEADPLLMQTSAYGRVSQAKPAGLPHHRGLR